MKLGVQLRVGIIVASGDQRADDSRRELEALGVKRIGIDRVRAFGRGSEGQWPDASNLCGRCGTGRAAIGPDGIVSPCIMSGWMGVGNVQDAALETILYGTAMAEANSTIRSASRGAAATASCYPDSAPCAPDQAPPVPCGPDQECSPGHPTDKCEPDGY